MVYEFGEEQARNTLLHTIVIISGEGCDCERARGRLCECEKRGDGMCGDECQCDPTMCRTMPRDDKEGGPSEEEEDE